MNNPKRVLVLDTETTGLTLPSCAPLVHQPHIIEICGMEVVDGVHVDTHHTLVNPGVRLEPIITNITGLTQKDVQQAPQWKEVQDEWVEIFESVDTIVAHNITFDTLVIRLELLRTDFDRGCWYEWPWNHQLFCTVEQTQHLLGYRLKMNELHTLMTGKTMTTAHRAQVDTMALVETYLAMRERGMTDYYD